MNVRSAGPTRPAARSELDARFERDALPLIDLLFVGALRLTGDRHDAQDLVQETMLLAYSGFHRFSEGTNMKAWLYRIMHNAWISQHRKKQRRPTEVSIDYIADGSVNFDVMRTTTSLRPVEVAVLESLPDEEIRDALMTLPEEQRIAIYYADVEGLAYKEIANVMGTSVGTVMSRLHRGRQRLRTALIAVATRRRMVPNLEAG